MGGTGCFGGGTSSSKMGDKKYSSGLDMRFLPESIMERYFNGQFHLNVRIIYLFINQKFQIYALIPPNWP